MPAIKLALPLTMFKSSWSFISDESFKRSFTYLFSLISAVGGLISKKIIGILSKNTIQSGRKPSFASTVRLAADTGSAMFAPTRSTWSDR